MPHGFRLTALPYEPFAPLFELSDTALAARGIERCLATERPGFPCRVSLEDAAVGEEVLLLSIEHQAEATPFRASGPIFVRRGAVRGTPAAGELPPYVTRRTISARAYDARHRIVDAAVCEGTALAPEIERMFASGEVAYLHLHNARRGCFFCRVDRAEGGRAFSARGPRGTRTRR